MSVTIRAALEADLSPHQRTLIGDVLLVAEALAGLESREYQRQDEEMARLREVWERLEQALPGATTVFASRDVDAGQTG